MRERHEAAAPTARAGDVSDADTALGDQGAGAGTVSELYSSIQSAQDRAKAAEAESRALRRSIEVSSEIRQSLGGHGENWRATTTAASHETASHEREHDTSLPASLEERLKQLKIPRDKEAEVRSLLEDAVRSPPGAPREERKSPSSRVDAVRQRPPRLRQGRKRVLPCPFTLRDDDASKTEPKRVEHE